MVATGSAKKQRISRTATVTASPNIAFIKYWGKRDEQRMLPLNDSMSLTVDALQAKTTLVAETSLDCDSVVINGEEVAPLPKSFQRCFAAAKELIAAKRSGEENAATWFFHVESTTNFPVAAGLASSSAGFAAIARAIGHLFELEDHDVATIARLGSGSATRSIRGGLIQWKAGKADDGSDCVIECVLPPSHWPSLRMLILVLAEGAKETPSSCGMARTVATSHLLAHRISSLPLRIAQIRRAFDSRYFSSFGRLVMEDSNELHAVCMDSFPPLRYMNDHSWLVVDWVNHFNENAGSVKAAYTFDAGVNACVLVEEENVAALLSSLLGYFELSMDLFSSVPEAVRPSLPAFSSSSRIPLSVSRVFLSTLGSEPIVE